MAESNDATAIRARKIAKMGPELGQLHYELWNELAWIHAKWKDYRHLYASEETIAVLNEAAPAFFYFLETIMFEDVLLHIARLTDRPDHGGRTNLTLQSLPALMTDAALRAKVDALLAEVLTRTHFAHDRRNRRIAHRDLLTFRGLHPRPLPGASRQNVEDALAVMRQLMNEIEYALENSTTAYEAFIGLGGAESLTTCLKRGVDYRDEDIERRAAKRLAGVDPDA